MTNNAVIFTGDGQIANIELDGATQGDRVLTIPGFSGMSGKKLAGVNVGDRVTVFNLQNGSRVAVPFQAIQPMQSQKLFSGFDGGTVQGGNYAPLYSSKVLINYNSRVLLAGSIDGSQNISEWGGYVYIEGNGTIQFGNGWPNSWSGVVDITSIVPNGQVFSLNIIAYIYTNQSLGISDVYLVVE